MSLSPPAIDTTRKRLYELIGDLPSDHPALAKASKRKKHPLLDITIHGPTRFNQQIADRFDAQPASGPFGFQNPGYIYRKSLEHCSMLKKTGLTTRALLLKPHSERGLYADPITREFVTHPEFHHEFDESDECYKQWDVTSLANSYCALDNLTDEALREKYAKSIRGFIDYIAAKKIK